MATEANKTAGSVDGTVVLFWSPVCVPFFAQNLDAVAPGFGVVDQRWTPRALDIGEKVGWTEEPQDHQLHGKSSSHGG